MASQATPQAGGVAHGRSLSQPAGKSAPNFPRPTPKNELMRIPFGFCKLGLRGGGCPFCLPPCIQEDMLKKGVGRKGIRRSAKTTRFGDPTKRPLFDKGLTYHLQVFIKGVVDFLY